MTQESFGDQQAQDADDQREYGGEPVGQSSEQQEQREEMEYGDSATAVSPDTQFSDPGEITDDVPQDDLASRGQSTTFDDPAKPRASSDVDEGPHGDEDPRPPGTADEDRNPDQADAFAENAGDQDAEPPTSGDGEQSEVTSGDDVDGASGAQASYGDEQDAAPSQAPYEQQ
jgi:hypothetical protein